MFERLGVPSAAASGVNLGRLWWHRTDVDLPAAERGRRVLQDAWLGSAVLEEQSPYSPLGFPAGGTPSDEMVKLGLTLEATPTLDEVLAARLARMAVMRRTVGALTETELDRICGRKPADAYPDQEYVVRRCLKVILKEEAEHHRYAVRDLATLETSA